MDVQSLSPSSHIFSYILLLSRCRGLFASTGTAVRTARTDWRCVLTACILETRLRRLFIRVSFYFFQIFYLESVVLTCGCKHPEDAGVECTSVFINT